MPQLGDGEVRVFFEEDERQVPGTAASSQSDQVGRGVVARLALPRRQNCRDEGDGGEGDPLGTQGPHEKQLLHRDQSGDEGGDSLLE